MPINVEVVVQISREVDLGEEGQSRCCRSPVRILGQSRIKQYKLWRNSSDDHYQKKKSDVFVFFIATTPWHVDKERFMFVERYVFKDARALQESAVETKSWPPGNGGQRNQNSFENNRAGIAALGAIGNVGIKA